jgi:hypothetical protein
MHRCKAHTFLTLDIWVLYFVSESWNRTMPHNHLQ